MKKNFILSSILMLFAVLVFSGCKDNEPYQSLQPSPRDGVYEGANLTVTIDGEPATSIKSVRIFSETIGYAQGIIVGGNPIEGSNPVFHTSVIFNGFPGTNKEISLMTVSTLYYFDGECKIRVTDGIEYYEFSGTFTGDPESPHSQQGLILEFTSIDNPS